MAAPTDFPHRFPPPDELSWRQLDHNLGRIIAGYTGHIEALQPEIDEGLYYRKSQLGAINGWLRTRQGHGSTAQPYHHRDREARWRVMCARLELDCDDLRAADWRTQLEPVYRQCRELQLRVEGNWLVVQNDT